jgi:hypothetical protein
MPSVHTMLRPAWLVLTTKRLVRTPVAGCGGRDAERLVLPEPGDAGAILADGAIEPDRRARPERRDDLGAEHPGIGRIHDDVAAVGCRAFLECIEVGHWIDRDDPRVVVEGDQFACRRFRHPRRPTSEGPQL